MLYVGTVLLIVNLASAQDQPILYLCLDRTLQPAVAARGVALSSAGEIEFEAGILGEGALINADLRFLVGGLFPVPAGTFAAWIKPKWSGDDPTSHTLMCIYGPPDGPNPWSRNRWSVVASGGRLRFFIFSDEGDRSVGVDAPILDWKPDEWHHIATTWDRVGEAGSAQMRLYLDGELAAEISNLDLRAGRPGEVLDIGRDSDASPDYAEALYDEVYLYARALSAAEIRTAVEAVRTGNLPAPAKPPTAPREVEGWAYPDLPFRASIWTEPSDRVRLDGWFEAALGIGRDLMQLGVHGVADSASFRLTEILSPPDFSEVTTFQVEADRVRFVARGDTAAGASRRFALYFDVLPYHHVAPLLVRRAQSDRVSPPPAPATPPDYATAAYNDAWDFDEGDTEAIDRFGDRPEYFRNIRVENGALVATVTQDPYLIWGTMWGPEDLGQRRVRIDLDDFSVVEMRVRQSVPEANWALFGRVAGSDELLSYRFRVVGTTWQTLRVHLVQEARWGGVLSAFRIDPTEEVEAEVAIDWVRLLPTHPARREPVELLGEPTALPRVVTFSLDADGPIVAGSKLRLQATVTDEAGHPVARQPIRVWLQPGSGGSLENSADPAIQLSSQAVRGLTDEEGHFAVLYCASPKAGTDADVVRAETEFPAVSAAPLGVTTVPGPAHHYRVLSEDVTIVREEIAPLELTAEPVDVYGNPTPAAPPSEWHAHDARIERVAGQPSTVLLHPDLSKRWVYTVTARSEKLSGESGPICFLPRGPKANRVILGDNGYFRTADGRPYLPLGGFYINWIGMPDPQTGEQGRILRSFTDVDEAAIVQWLSYLREQGVTTLRLMLRTHTKVGLEPMDVGGRVNRPLFAKVLRLMDLARPFGLRFLLVIHDDYGKPVYCNAPNLERFSLPRFAGEDLDALPPHQRRFIRDRKLLRLASEKYSDPDAIRCQDDYARELIGYLKDNPQVFAYELENEMVNCPQTWAAHVIEVIRSVDPDTPICVSHGGGGLHTADPLWWTRHTPIDFYTYHLYPTYCTDAVTDYGAAVLRLAKYGQLAGVCFLGESSGDEFSDYPADRAADRRYIMRDIIWMSLIAGNPGCFFWNARGYEVEEFRLASEIMSTIDWTHWVRARPAVAIVVDHPTVDDKYYRSPQGMADQAMMGRYCQDLLSAGVDFDFVVQAEGYEKVGSLSEFVSLRPDTHHFRVSPGYQLAALSREGLSEGLLYLRNFTGIREWSPPSGKRMWLRQRAPASLSVAFNVPPQEIVVQWWDLDTAQTGRQILESPGTLDLGESDHDFAIRWHAR